MTDNSIALLTKLRGDLCLSHIGREGQRAQNERTRRKLVSPTHYLLASDLAEKPIASITTADVNAYVEWRMKVGAITFAKRNDGARYKTRTDSVSASTINKSLKVLSSALRLAMDEGVIERLPKIQFLPEHDARPVMPPTESEYTALVATAHKLRPLAPVLPELIELLAEFGFRPGEALNLTWGSIDMSMGEGPNKGGVRVEEQKRTNGGPWVPKNKKHRFIPCTPRGRELLLKLKRDAVTSSPTDLVIPNTDGLPYIRLDNGPMKGGGAGVWKKLAELSGVKATMRDLRHYFAVQSLMRGVPMHVVSQWMGHSKIDLTTKRYGRFSAESREQWHWAALRSTPVSEVTTQPRHLVSVSPEP